MRPWIVAGLLAVGLTACADDAGPTSTAPTTEPSTSPAGQSEPGAERVAHDPPLQFDETGVRLGWRLDALALHAGVAYAYAGDGLGAADLATGEEIWHQPLEQSTAPVNTTAPVVAEVGGRVLVFGAYFASVPGDGISQASRLIRVTAFDTQGTHAWTVDVAEGTQIPADVSYPRIVAADGRHVVMTTDNQGDIALTVVLSATTGDELWRNDRFRASDLDSGIVAGIEPVGASIVDFRAVGHAVTDGRRVWTGPTVTSPVISDPGPGLSLLRGDTPDSIDPTTYLLDIRAGHPAVTLAAHYACHHDGGTTVVCAALAVGQEVDVIIGYDLRTHVRRWSLPDPATSRPAPEVTTVYGGLVYGNVPEGALVLDAPTGAVRRTELAVAPGLVTAGFGLVARGRFSLAHPSTA